MGRDSKIGTERKEGKEKDGKGSRQERNGKEGGETERGRKDDMEERRKAR